MRRKDPSLKVRITNTGCKVPFENKTKALKVIPAIEGGDKVALSDGEGELRQVVSARGGL